MVSKNISLNDHYNECDDDSIIDSTNVATVLYNLPQLSLRQKKGRRRKQRSAVSSIATITINRCIVENNNHLPLPD
jgi:hypothetical protein